MYYFLYVPNYEYEFTQLLRWSISKWRSIGFFSDFIFYDLTIRLSVPTCYYDNISDTVGPHYLNFLYQLTAIRSSRGSTHLRPKAFHMFYKYTADITYITESGRKKNKQEQSWVSPKRKKGEVFFILSANFVQVHLWLSQASTWTKFPQSYQKALSLSSCTGWPGF